MTLALALTSSSSSLVSFPSSRSLSLLPVSLSRLRLPVSASPPSLSLSLSLAFTPHSLLLPRASASDLGRQIEFEGGGFGGGGQGSGTGGGGGGGDGDGDGGEDFEEEEENRSGMLMSQKFTLAYAALVGVGGVMGFVKKGSIKSGAAGGLSSLLLFYVYTQLPSNPTFASSLGLGISGALLAVMGSRFKNSGKIFPAGVVSLVSLFMTGGYLHAILRAAH